MSPTRRDFLGTTALAGGALGRRRRLARRRWRRCWRSRRPAPLRILVLGGTGFIGPHQVRYAVARGHTVTLFNRGRTNPGLFKGVSGIEERIGDRAPNPGNYDALKSGEWDVVIDNPTTRPRWVREAAAAVQGRAGHYVFISTISVYASQRHARAPTRRAAVATTTTPEVESGPEFPPLYGPLKALAEKEAEKAFPGRATIIRPGLIVGVGDATDRFTYWPVRIARGGEVLAPPAADPVQIIDARDLAEWTIRCCEDKVYGVFNATGPASRFTVGQMLDGIRIDARCTRRRSSTPPLRSSRRRSRRCAAGRTCRCGSRPRARPPGFTQRSIAKALAKGLTFRPFPDTVKETMAFYAQQTDERKAQLRAGLPADREARVLAAWKSKG